MSFVKIISLCALMLSNACAAISLTDPSDASYSAADSVDASADAGARECWCCVRPDGEDPASANAFCMRGSTTTHECVAYPVEGASPPSWAPASTVCDTRD